MRDLDNAELEHVYGAGNSYGCHKNKTSHKCRDMKITDKQAYLRENLHA